MGWMHDTLHYCQTDFPFRPGNHKLLTFSTMYQFNENFVLPLSHDEVVHGKCSLITRMPGDNWRQFAGLRNLAFYQLTHAGGALNFMGNEIGQFIEWRYYEGIEYFLTDQFESHAKHQQFVKALNAFYNAHPALWQCAYEEKSFDWIDADNSDQCIISFARHSDTPKDDLVVVMNFEVNPHEEFRLGMPRPGVWEEVFNTDAEEFGGSGVTNAGSKFKTEETPWNNQDQSIVLRVPPLGGTILRYVRALPAKRTTKKATTTKTKTTATKTKAAAKSTSTASKAKTATKATSTAKKSTTTKATSTAKKTTATKAKSTTTKTATKAKPAASKATKRSTSTGTAKKDAPAK
jgi:1,4-alpha-glucan branching enzyme